MQPRSLIPLLVALLAFAARAQVPRYVTLPLNVAVASPTDLAHTLFPSGKRFRIVGAQAALFYGEGHLLYGFDVAGFQSRWREDARGAVVCGIKSLVNGDLTGAQAAGVINETNGSAFGAQAAGFVNWTDGAFGGIQAATIFNRTGGAFYGFQTTGALGVVGGDAYGFQLAPLYTRIGDDLVGLQIGAGLNIISSDLLGFQTPGLFNYIGGDMTGGQLAVGGAAIGADALGAQLAGLFAHCGGSFTGIQASALFNNVNGDLLGAQAGVFNRAVFVPFGVQVGVLNSAARHNGLPIGVVSVVKNAPRYFETSVTDSRFVDFAYRSGNRFFYNYVALGARADTYLRWSVSYGLGLRFRYRELEVDLGARSRHVIEDRLFSTDLNFLHTVALDIGYPVARHTRILLSPTFNLWQSRLHDGGELSVIDGTLETEGDVWLRSWFGFSIGLRY